MSGRGERAGRWGIIRARVSRLAWDLRDAGVRRRFPVQTTEEGAARRRERLHVLEGLLAVGRDPHGFLDSVLEAGDEESAKKALQERWGLSDVQATAALNLQLRNLTVASRRLLAEDARSLED